MGYSNYHQKGTTQSGNFVFSRLTTPDGQSLVARGGVAVPLMDPSSTRYDLFIVLHDNVGDETKQLAKSVERKANECRDGKPGVCSSADTVVSKRHTIFDAILKTRGGGIVLFFLSRRFFLKCDRYSLAALLVALELEKAEDERKKVKVAFVWDDAPRKEKEEKHTVLKEILSRFVVIDRRAQHGSNVGFDRTIVHAVTALWDSESPTALGGTLEDSLLNLTGLFTKDDVARLKAVLGIGDSRVLSVDEVFCEIIHGNAQKWRSNDRKNPDVLRSVIAMRKYATDTTINANLYFDAFHRKWKDCDDIGWGDSERESLKQKMLEADLHIALSTLKDAISHCGLIINKRHFRERELLRCLLRIEKCLKGDRFLEEVLAKMTQERKQVDDMGSLRELGPIFENIDQGCRTYAEKLTAAGLPSETTTTRTTSSGQTLAEAFESFATTSVEKMEDVAKTLDLELGFPEKRDYVTSELGAIYDRITIVENRISALEEPAGTFSASGASQVATS